LGTQWKRKQSTASPSKAKEKNMSHCKAKLPDCAYRTVHCAVCDFCADSHLQLSIDYQGLANPDECSFHFQYFSHDYRIWLNEDTIMKGDLVFIKKIDTDEIKKGDIIAFFEDKFVVTHRVIDVQIGQDGQKSFQTKGDHNVSPDLLPVLPENVVGIYIGRIPKMGDFAVFLQTPVGMIVIIGARY
jgi:hypothetical protein